MTGCEIDLLLVRVWLTDLSMRILFLASCNHEQIDICLFDDISFKLIFLSCELAFG